MLNSFLQKPLGIATLLGTAVGAPYAAFETDIGKNVRQQLTTLVSSRSTTGDPSQASSPTDPASLAYAPANLPQPNSTGMYNGGYNPGTYNPGLPASGYAPYTGSQYPAGNYSGQPTIVSYGTPTIVPQPTSQPMPQQMQQPGPSIGGGFVTDLREVLRFDIRPNWLPQRFARVTTVLSNVQLDGLRVPLVTGTQPNDLAGSLTYYFDASQTLKRVQLHGMTGDASGLVSLMLQYYQLQPEQSLGGQLMTARWNNRVTSMLHVAPAPIIYAGADHSKYTVFLELNQPSTSYGLSDEAAEVLRNAQATQRW